MSLAVALADDATAHAVRLVLGGALCVALWIALWPLIAELVRRIHPGRLVFFARWGFSHVALAILLFLAVALLWMSFGPSGGFLLELTGNLLALLAVALWACRVAERQHPEGWRALGFERGRHGTAAAAAALAYAASFPGLAGLGTLTNGLQELFGGAQAQRVLSEIVALGSGELVLALLVAVLVVPFLEELVFRGFLQPLLVQNLGDRGGVTATAVLFGFLHGPRAFLPTFGVALLCGALMLRTRRLSAPFVAHALHNGIALAFAVSAQTVSESA